MVRGVVQAWCGASLASQTLTGIASVGAMVFMRRLIRLITTPSMRSRRAARCNVRICVRVAALASDRAAYHDAAAVAVVDRVGHNRPLVRRLALRRRPTRKHSSLP